MRGNRNPVQPERTTVPNNASNSQRRLFVMPKFCCMTTVPCISVGFTVSFLARPVANLTRSRRDSICTEIPIRRQNRIYVNIKNVPCKHRWRCIFASWDGEKNNQTLKFAPNLTLAWPVRLREDERVSNASSGLLLPTWRRCEANSRDLTRVLVFTGGQRVTKDLLPRSKKNQNEVLYSFVMQGV